MRPSIGRIVIYRSRTGKYSVPAIITATKDTLVQENVEKGKERSCCPGDDIAYAHNIALDQWEQKIKELMK